MAWWMWTNRQVVAKHLNQPTTELVFVFANTGLEHEDTLRFVDALAREFKLPLVWVEGVAQVGRVSTQHRVTNYEKAYRNDQWRDKNHPFHAFIHKYGVPNVKFKSCTREMKRNTIHSYMASLGQEPYYTAIGIRADEQRRVSKNAGVDNIIYPLVDMVQTDKEDVLAWWSQYEWDLKIPEWLGNCVTCYKKSFKKLRAVWQEHPEYFEFNAAMEAAYPRVGPEFQKYGDATDRTFFRMGMSTKALLRVFQENPEINNYGVYDGGCSESCELYETESTDDGPTPPTGS